MNNPAPTFTSPGGRPDPTTPGPQPKPTALTAATTTALAGTPASALIVWLLARYGHVSDPVTAATLGSVIASATGYLWRIAQALLAKWGINPGAPP